MSYKEKEAKSRISYHGPTCIGNALERWKGGPEKSQYPIDIRRNERSLLHLHHGRGERNTASKSKGKIQKSPAWEEIK